MADQMSSNCQCRQKQGEGMKISQQLGLDELMIVNPSSSTSDPLFLGEDGTLYQVQGLDEEEAPQGMGQFFLGEDGTLYQVQGFEGDGSTNPIRNSAENLGEEDGRDIGRYFLGEDGTLYEVVR